MPWSLLALVPPGDVRIATGLIKEKMVHSCGDGSVGSLCRCWVQAPSIHCRQSSVREAKPGQVGEAVGVSVGISVGVCLTLNPVLCFFQELAARDFIGSFFPAGLVLLLSLLVHFSFLFSLTPAFDLNVFFFPEVFQSLHNKLASIDARLQAQAMQSKVHAPPSDRSGPPEPRGPPTLSSSLAGIAAIALLSSPCNSSCDSPLLDSGGDGSERVECLVHFPSVSPSSCFFLCFPCFRRQSISHRQCNFMPPLPAASPDPQTAPNCPELPCLSACSCCCCSVRSWIGWSGFSGATWPRNGWRQNWRRSARTGRRKVARTIWMACRWRGILLGKISMGRIYW